MKKIIRNAQRKNGPRGWPTLHDYLPTAWRAPYVAVPEDGLDFTASSCVSRVAALVRCERVLIGCLNNTVQWLTLLQRLSLHPDELLA